MIKRDRTRWGYKWWSTADNDLPTDSLQTYVDLLQAYKDCINENTNGKWVDIHQKYPESAL